MSVPTPPPAQPPTQARPIPPPPPSGSPSPSPRSTAPSSTRSFAPTSGVQSKYQRIVVYGPGGVGKSELCANLNQVGVKPLFLDIGNGTSFLNVDRVSDITTWADLRAVLHDPNIWKGYGAVIIDDLTKAEELAAEWTLANVPKERKDGTKETVSSIEGYGWGKGLTHVYETFLLLLGDLDKHVREGRQVVCIAHECTANVPNPSGEDWIRYEPRLQETPKGPIRSRVFEWCDHFFYIGYDVSVEDGRGSGSGTRTIYPAEMPTHKAKSRDLADPIVYLDGDAGLWNLLLKKGS